MGKCKETDCNREWKYPRLQLCNACYEYQRKRGLLETRHLEKHGGKGTDLYACWQSMKDRCYRQGNKLYRRYGGRGIEVCSEWRESFSLFRSWAERAGYRKGLEIDRIDNNGHYAPDNCRWTTKQANARNKSTNRMLTAYGETKTMMDWSEDPRCEVNYYTLRSRIYISGWEVEEALKRKPLRADKSA